ncbi:hypothetical protein KIPB_013791, partial [Kipferlia bialata]
GEDMCLGSCKAHTGFCIETKPKHCACSTCGFDLHSEACWGTCDYPSTCALVTNSTCACTTCGWATPAQDKCVGICNAGTFCSQAKEDSKCTCRNDACSYDYATHKCLGTCSHGSGMCIEYKPEKCACESCAYDYGYDKVCMLIRRP